jgi:hypothetical protein
LKSLVPELYDLDTKGMGEFKVSEEYLSKQDNVKFNKIILKLVKEVKKRGEE